MLGDDYSSKLSPYLALGCLSPRTILDAVREYEFSRVANKSTYWLVFEVLWRDFFRIYAAQHKNKLFDLWGPKGRPDSESKTSRVWKRDMSLFDRWRNGTTGVAFVDACMRELKETGFMSNRGRQCVASFLVHDLQLDWRLGAMWFQHALLDHDVCSNYGNWTYAAGVGCDPREGRYFKISKQARVYDSECKFIRAWLPELAAASNQDLMQSRNLHLVATSVYPKPVCGERRWNGSSDGKKKKKKRRPQKHERERRRREMEAKGL